MIPQKQKIFSAGNGDCFRACVASLLEIPNDEELLPNPHGDEWWFKWQDWFEQFGISINWDNQKIWRQGYWIATVASKNIEGGTHAIVMKGCKVAFDPSTKKRYRKGSSLLSDDVVHGGYWIEVEDFNKLKTLVDFREKFGIVEGL